MWIFTFEFKEWNTVTDGWKGSSFYSMFHTLLSVYRDGGIFKKYKVELNLCRQSQLEKTAWSKGSQKVQCYFKIFQPNIVEDICKSLLEQDSFMFIKVRYQSHATKFHASHLNSKFTELMFNIYKRKDACIISSYRNPIREKLDLL